MSQRNLHFKIICYAISFFVLLIPPPALAAMASSNYTVSSISQNQGSGMRSSSTYQIASDVISIQPTGMMSGSSYSLTGQALAPQNHMLSGIFINNDEPATNSTDVTLSLICGHKSGCAQMKFSNNGVSWSAPEAYSPTKDWTLVSNEGERTVYATYKNGLGDWSGVCSDSIILDMTAPAVTISPAGGTYMQKPQVTLTASETATIYYTTDNTDPTTGSPVYTSPITLTDDATVKTFAQDEAGNAGAISTEDYIVCNGTNMSISGVVKDGLFDEPMPLAVITLDNGATAATDIDGQYRFSSMAPGNYEIVSITTPSPGYVTYQKALTLCKNSIAHDIVLTKAESTFGGDTFAGYSVDSVNTATGNFFYAVTDLEIPGRGLPFGFDRTYNSQDDRDGPLSYGWTHNYNVSLSIGSKNEVTVRWGDGNAATWTYDETEGYTPMKGVYDTLVENPDGTFTVLRKDMIQYHFNAANHLSAIEDENGNRLTFTYTNGILTHITDTVGRDIDFSYDAEDRITRILDPIGRSVTFTYDLNGNLNTSTNLDGKTTVYTYDENHQMLTLTDPKENAVYSNVYDDQRRVIASQRDALGNETLYSYDVSTRTTQIVHPNGSSSYHYYDDFLRLIREKDPLGFSAYYEYNERGSLSKVTDKNGNVTAYQNDGNGNVQTKTDPLGHKTSATYDANNNPLSKTDAKSNTTTFTYDTEGNLLTITDPLNNTTTFTYDGYGQRLTKTDAKGGVTTYEYDSSGNLLKVTDAMGNESTFTYDGVSRKKTESHPLGRGSAYEYDSLNRLTSVVDALGGTVSFTYDDNGNKTEHTDANGNSTTFGYDAKNRLISETTPLNETETYTYDSMDRRTDVTNRRGKVTSVVYDEAGNVIQQRDADGNVVRNQYDANGNLISATDANGYTTTFKYDDLNRLTKVTNPFGDFTSRTYDENGNLLTTTDPTGKTTRYAYDILNRLVSTTDPLNHVTTSTYDKLGRLVKVTDPKGNETLYEYDALGRLIKVTDTASGTVEATYDALGNRTSLTDTRGNVTNYTYDKLNRLIQVTDPLGNTKQMHYDPVGNLIALVEPDGTSTRTYTYDANNRFKTLSYPDAGTVVSSYQYDANGNRLTVTDSMGTTSYAYNNRDALSSVADIFGKTIGYMYDPNGNRTVIQYPGANRKVTYSYDKLDRLSTVQDWNYVQTSYQYDQSGRLIQTDMGNGATVHYTYDDAGRLVSKVDRDPNGDVIASYDMTLDENGNRTAMTATQPLSPTVEAADVAFAHDEGNQLLSANDTTFVYDGKGNRISRKDGEITTQYAYDYRNMLTRVSDGTHVQEYGYNSDGHRLKATRDGVETRYLLDLNAGMENILAEMDGSNNISKYFVHGDGLLYSIDASTGIPVYYHYDTVGSTVALTDHSGNITDQYAYLPFGEAARSEGVYENPFTYVGKYGVMAEPNGLYFMRARYYDPGIKRFLSFDPIFGGINNSQRLNLYSYANNNPNSAIDPNGEIALAVIIIGVAAFTAAIWGPPLITALVGSEEMKKEAFSKKGLQISALSIVTPLSEIFRHPDNLKRAFKTLDYYKKGSGLDSNNSDNNLEIGGDPDNDCDGCELITTSNRTSAMARSSEFHFPVPQITKTTLKESLSDTNASQPKENKESGTSKRIDRSLVFSYASSYYMSEFSKLLNSNVINNQARSYIESRIYREVAARSQTRYRTSEKDKMLMDIRHNAGNLYRSFTQTLSKYSVLVKDLSEIPNVNSLNVNRRGVYAN